MKAPFRGRAAFSTAAPLAQSNYREPCYDIHTLDPRFKQDGVAFRYIVVRLQLNSEGKLEPVGAGVLCQTQAEADESLANLKARSKRDIGIVQVPGFGSVGTVSNHRRTIAEFKPICRTYPNRKKVWLAREIEIDQDTLAEKVIRESEAPSKDKAVALAKQWCDEYDRAAKSAKTACASKIGPPPTPPRCDPLTDADIDDDVPKAKLLALKRQWPRCFAIFERWKSEPITEQETQDAYLLDLAEQGGGLWPERQHFSQKFLYALAKAADHYQKRGVSKTTDAAIYLIAFNWELGWCFLPDAELAQKLSAILKPTTFTPGQVKQYRSRTLELVTKHKSGPSEKVP
jgi:hypothetical protein